MFKLKRTAQAFFACTLWHLAKRGFVVSVLSVLLLPLFFLTRGGVGVPHAYAATSDNLNFQARLETAAGAIAPDGYYNIQFKLYDALSGGTLLWTETYYDSNGVSAGNDNRVRVANGYVTVNLGSQTAFPGTMPWDQQLYLTMNVGGTTQTATPTWDGEMSPRLKLTAVPYAFNAKTASQIVTSSGANLATLSIAAPTSGNQTFTIQDQGAAGSYNILTQTQINAGFIQNQFGAAQTTSNFWLSGTGRADTAFQAPLFDSGTAAALGIGTTNATSISIGKSTITTTVQGPFVTNGSQFTNNGSTLLTGSTLSDFAVSGAIGTAAATVDIYTTFVIPQTTAGRTLSLPTPTTGTAGRLAYVLNTGSTAFTMHSVSIQAGKAQTYIYDGSAWTATNIDGAGNGATFIGTIDSQTKSADGAVISGNGVYLQTADGTNPGLVSTGVQTFAGNKTFSGTVTATAGGSIYGGTISLNANSNFDTNINTGTSTGAVAIGNSAAGNISVQSGGTISVLGATNINTTGTSTTTIGSATAGAVSITSNAASSFTTNTGALTLTSAAAATWGTNAGLLTLQGAGGATVTSTAGTTSSNTTISTGNASAGASGNIVIDTGTATTTAGTVSIGTTNASGVTIGRAATTTTIQGNTVVTLSASTGSTFVCQNGSSQLATCTSTPLTSTTGIQNQNASAQTSANFWIDGTGRADSSVLTPLVDTATAVALNIGTTNATSINLNQDTVLAAGQSITITGGTTASRPASPTEGMVYYDTTTKQLLVYNATLTKWTADRTDAILVAASDSSAADKAAADYLGDGNTGAAADGDQVQINQALTAATGKKVVLLAGTYTIDASISVPNNTTLSGIGQGTLITIPNALNTNFSAIVNTDTTTGTNVTLRDLKLDGNKANQTMGAGTGMAGVDFNNMGGGTGSSARQGARISGIQANNWDGLAGSNCQVGVGICLRNSNNNSLTGNTAQANILYSFALISSSSNNTLTNNTAQGSSTDGFFISSSSNNTLTGNTAQGNSGVGFYVSSSNSNTLTGNTAQGNTSYGIVATSSSNNTISGNTSQGNSSYGIFITTSSSSNTVASNTVQGNTNYGIYISVTSTNNVFTGNSVRGNLAGIVVVSDTNTISGNSVADNGGATANNGIYVGAAANSTITGNTITDTSCTTTCYAINLVVAGATNTYLSNNAFSTTSGTATINDAGTGTIYAGQAMTQGGLDIRFKQANSTAAVNIQNANGVNVLNVDTTNGELELGSYNGGTNPVAGKIVFATTANSNTVTLASATQTGSYTLSIPALTANADICTSQNNCGGLTSTTGIQNQNSVQQASANFWISGTGRADTSILTPLLDTATATTLNIGTTNATQINLNKNVSIAANQNITFAAGTGNFDQSASSGTFATGTGAVTLNGDTTVATGKNFTVTSGTTSLTGTTNINTTGAATTTIGTGTGNNNIGNATGTLALTGSTVTVLGTTTINTTGTATTAIGNSTGTLQLSSNTFNLSTAGAITGATGITMASGNFLQNGAGTFGTGSGAVSLNGAVSAASTVDITGSLATKKGTDYSTTGTTNDVNFGDVSLVRLTGASAQTITGISGGRDGEWLAIVNAGTTTATISNNAAGSLAANRITTGTGADLSLAAGASIDLIYDSGASLWRVVGGAAGAGGGGANTALSNLASVNINTALNTTAGNLTLQTTTSGNININPAGTGVINLQNNTVVAAGKSITLTGGNTASRPASPSDGMVYYDTTTKQLLVYDATVGNTKWKSTAKSVTKIVAASNASQSLKDAADYVATGTNDQNTINTALTAAAGGIVYLTEGTFSISAAISIPNTTVLAGAGNGSLITLPNAQNGTYNMLQNTDTTTGTDIVIRDLKIDGNRANQTTGNMKAILLNNMGGGSGASARPGARITGVTVVNIKGNASGSALYLTASSNNTIENNILVNYENYCIILLAGSHYNTVTSNTCQSTSTALGIGVVSSSNNSITNNVIQGASTGISVQSASGNTVTSNSVSGAINGISTSTATYNTISANNIQNSGSFGMNIGLNSNYNTINSNTISTTGSYGMLIAGNNNSIDGNTLFDSGGATSNDALYISADNNIVTDNNITDTSCTTTCYAINIPFFSADTNYLAGNVFGATGTIQDAGTGTRYAGQAMTAGGLDIRFKQANSTAAVTIQNANGVNVMNVDTTNGELELGAYNGGTNPVAGKIVFATTSNNNTVALASATQTGFYTLSIPALAGNAIICTDNSTTACNNFIQNQTGSTQTGGFKISGAGTLGGLLTANAGLTVTGAAINLNTASNFAVNIASTSNTAAVTIGNSANVTNIGSNTTYFGTNNGTIVLTAAAQTGAAAGNNLTIKAGSGGTGNQNGGTLALSGGDASGTGVKGLVTLNPTAFIGTSQNCTVASCSITAATVDANSTALVNNTYAGSTVTLADPTLATAGRVLYVTNSGTQDMTLSVNGGGTGNTIALKPNTTATMFWNGVDWTAAGASSATDLQAAYNNTQSTAGGAEIVLKSTLDTPAGTGGMTIRNNSGLPISGGLLEVQTSIGTNLFSVNSYGTELASNGGAETAGGSATTFPSSTWSAQSTATVSRTITSGEYQTGEAGVKVVTTGSNQGVRNQLTGNPVASTTYTVSFTAASTTAGQFTTPIEVIYSPDNGTTLTNICQGYGLEGTTLRTTFRNISNATNYNWTKVTCTVTTTGAAVTTPLLIIRQTDATARTLYVDNLSFIRNDSTTRPANVQMGGGNTGGQVTLFTLDRSSTAPLVSNGDDRYIGSMYYDTTLGNIQCYEADGWGACGSAPDNIITYTPEYTGAVLNGTGVGTMTADFCGNGGGLSVNTGFCATGEARNYYRWTSPQASDQTYSIYVSYRLPSTFKEFESGTTSLISLVDNTSNASVKYAIFKKTSTGGLTSCSADATMSGTVSTWNSTTPTTDLGTGACHTGGATPFAAGDTMVVRITVSAKSNASAYVENLTFRYSNK